jgi:hypothetical protein
MDSQIAGTCTALQLYPQQCDIEPNCRWVCPRITCGCAGMAGAIVPPTGCICATRLAMFGTAGMLGMLGRLGSPPNAAHAVNSRGQLA